MLPPFVREIHVKASPADNQLVAAGRERAGRADANDIIVCFAEWYAQVRATYGGATAEAQASAITQRCAVDERGEALVKRR